MITASDVMTENVVTIGPEATVQEAIELLLQQRISGLPVTDGQGHLVGIITEFALLAITYDQKVCADCVSRHMTTDVLSVAPDDGINKVADLCIVHRVRRVPVVAQGRLLGLISRRDVLKAIYGSTQSTCSA